MTTARQLTDKLLYLFVGGIAIGADKPGKVECLACQRMVGIHGDAIALHLHNGGHELLILRPGKGYYGTREYMLTVELTVNTEHFTLQHMHALGIMLAKSLSRLQREVERVTLLMLEYLLLKSIEGYSEAGNEFKWTIGAGLLQQMAFFALNSVQLIDN